MTGYSSKRHAAFERLGVRPASGFVNDERLLAGFDALGVGNAQVGPGVEFSDDLVESNAAGNDGLDHFVGGHARHLEIGSAANAVL